MPIEIGNASSHIDLLAKLRTFLTATLPSNIRWQEQRYITTAGSEELILRGVGSAGTDFIYIGFKAYSITTGQGNYGLILNGFTGYNAALGFYEQPGAMTVTSTLTALPLQSTNTTNYWFIANGRRVIIIAQVGSVFHQAYLGFMIPYGTPSQWPYPLVIGGSAAVRNAGSSVGIPIEGTSTTNAVHAFWKPINVSDSVNFTASVGNLVLRSPGGDYRRPYIVTGSPNNSAYSGTWPYTEATRNTYGGILNMRSVLNSSTYSLTPIMITEGSPPNVWGEFDGIRHITGFNLNATFAVTVNEVSWMCVNNVFRTGSTDMMAVRLD